MAAEFTKELREIARRLEQLVGEIHTLNVTARRIHSEMQLKQFADLTPPPKGAVYQNFKGCTVMNTEDFEEMERGDD